MHRTHAHIRSHRVSSDRVVRGPHPQPHNTRASGVGGCPRAGRLESRFGIQALKHINNGEKPVTLGAAGRVDLEEDCGERKIECHPGPYPQGRVRDAGRRADSHNPRREGHVRDDARARARGCRLFQALVQTYRPKLQSRKSFLQGDLQTPNNN